MTLGLPNYLIIHSRHFTYIYAFQNTKHTPASMRALCIIFICIASFNANAQEALKYIAAESRFAIDADKKIIVWNPGDEEVSRNKINALRTLKFGSRTFSIAKDEISDSTVAVTIIRGKERYSLYLSALPIFHIKTNEPIVDEPKTVAKIAMALNDTVIRKIIGIELRGNSALRYPKKSYDLEFRENATEETSTDVQFFNMRNDDDWILNSIYNEPLRLRSFFSNNLWLKVRATGMAEDENMKQPGIKVQYVEVFLDDSYQGLYLLSEQVDRKLLKLEKFEDNVVRGELFKAGSYQEGCAFTAAPPFNKNLPSWAGFDMEYPYEDYTAHWDNLADFVKFVSESDDSTFNSGIAERLDMDNAIDYFLYVNLLRATDNLGKNYFLARQDSNQPYYFIPWDLDGVLGIIQDGKRIPTTDDILSNGLFDRLWENDAANFRRRVRDRWLELRKEVYSEWSLMGEIAQVYDLHTVFGIYERERISWQSNSNNKEDLEYMQSWLQDRLEYLDGYFSEE